MRVFAIGFGQAGGKILDLFIEHERRTLHKTKMHTLAINTARTDLLGLKNVPMKDRILIGQTYVKGHGVGTDNALGAKIAMEEIETILSEIDNRGTHDIDAFLIISGLGGGTGSGGAPVLAHYLSKMYSEPVYAFGVLPAPEEGSLYSLNAARSMVTLIKETDNLILFDNGAWKYEGISLRESYGKINEEIVRRLGILFRSGEVGESNEVGEMVVDSSEIINTFRGGGVSSIGYAAYLAENRKKRKLFGRSKEEPFESDIATKISSLVRRAALGRLTIPCDIRSAERALILVAGPSEYLDRKGIEKAKSWLESNINGVEVRAGDYPVKSKYIAAVVLLSNVTEVPRVKELQKIAAEAREGIKEAEKIREKKKMELFDEDIEPLF